MMCCCKLESSRNSQEGPRPPAHHCWRCGMASPVFPGVQVPAALPWRSPGASPLELPRWEACAPKAPAPSPPLSLAPSPAAHSLKGVGQSCTSSQPATPENKENAPPARIVIGPRGQVWSLSACRGRAAGRGQGWRNINHSYPASPVPFSFFPWGWRTSRGKTPADCLTGDQPQAAWNGAPGAVL